MLLARRNNSVSNWLNSWFNDNFFDTELMPHMNATAPAVNVKEDATAYKMEIAAPGLKKDMVKITNTGFIDGRIPKTKVLIEQKSLEIDLKKEKLQSDGQMCTPFQQAKRYISALPLSDHPRWVVLSNFKSFLIFDMEQPNGEPFEVLWQKCIVELTNKLSCLK